MNLVMTQAILSLLVFIIMLAWSFNGPGVRKTRILLTTAYLLLQGYSWFMVWVFGALHTIGAWAVGLCFVTSIIAIIVLATYQRIHRIRNT